jgi:hypothetical protein
VTPTPIETCASDGIGAAMNAIKTKAASATRIRLCMFFTFLTVRMTNGGEN